MIGTNKVYRCCRDTIYGVRSENGIYLKTNQIKLEVNLLSDLPKRKNIRLKSYDYSQNGYYYVTICTENNIHVLSDVNVGRGLAPAETKLTEMGKICEEQLLELENRYMHVKIDKYVIMPTHIHVIININETAGASPRPTLSDIVCAFKSLSTRLCNQQANIQKRKIWQTSFYEEVIRNEAAYQEVWEYIDTNPIKWETDCYYN